MKPSILLVDDHTMFRAGLRSIIKTEHPEALITEAADGAAVLRMLDTVEPDLVILDLKLPDQNGIELSRQILRRFQATRIILLSAAMERAQVRDAFEAGIAAYLHKSSSPDEVMQAVNSVLRGELYACRGSVPVLLEDYKKSLTQESNGSGSALSNQERRVLERIVQGQRAKEIAAGLGIGTRTVETYRRRVAEKTGCQSKADLLLYALKEHITS